MSQKLSVVIPTLNTQHVLPSTLESLMEGVFAGVIGDLVIVDGGSTDAPKKAKKGVKGFIKKQAQKVVDRMSEEVSVDDQMRISHEAAKKRNPNPDHKAIRGKMLKKPLPKDTRTDAQKMTDATGPRPGSRYRGD